MGFIIATKTCVLLKVDTFELLKSYVQPKTDTVHGEGKRYIANLPENLLYRDCLFSLRIYGTQQHSGGFKLIGHSSAGFRTKRSAKQSLNKVLRRW